VRVLSSFEDWMTGRFKIKLEITHPHWPRVSLNTSEEKRKEGNERNLSGYSPLHTINAILRPGGFSKGHAIGGRDRGIRRKWPGRGVVKYGTVGGAYNRANGVDAADEEGRRERIWLLCKVVVKWS
jgi:hypothetical protein